MREIDVEIKIIVGSIFAIFYYQLKAFMKAAVLSKDSATKSSEKPASFNEPMKTVSANCFASLP